MTDCIPLLKIMMKNIGFLSDLVIILAAKHHFAFLMEKELVLYHAFLEKPESVIDRSGIKKTGCALKGFLCLG